jgi:hypothetical protein
MLLLDFMGVLLMEFFNSNFYLSGIEGSMVDLSLKVLCIRGASVLDYA